MVCFACDGDDDKKKAPPSEEDEARKKREMEKAAEEGVDSAHDFMKMFLKKSED